MYEFFGIYVSMDIPKMIKLRRVEIEESQTTFGNRFGVGKQSVSDWENGRHEAPYKVLRFVLNKNIPPNSGEDQVFIRKDLAVTSNIMTWYRMHDGLHDFINRIKKTHGNIEGIVLRPDDDGNVFYDKLIGFSIPPSDV